MHQTPDDLVALNTYANEFTAGVVRAKLEDAGIPAQAITANGPLLGAFGANGWIPFTVWVRKVDEERAKAVLEAVRTEQGTVDWDAVDVGEPDPGDQAAQRAASDTNPPRSTHARLAFAGVLLILSIVCWELANVFGGTIPVLAWGAAIIGFVCFLAATTLAFGVFFMSRTGRK